MKQTYEMDELKDEYNRLNETVAKIDALGKQMNDVYDIYYRPTGTVGNHIKDDKHSLKEIIFRLHWELIAAENRIDYLSRHAPELGLSAEGLGGAIMAAGGNWEVLMIVADHNSIIKQIRDQHRKFAGWLYQADPVNAYINRVEALKIAEEKAARKTEA